MAGIETRDQRASRWRTIGTFATFTIVAVTSFQIGFAASALAQVKAPAKQQMRVKAAVPKADPSDTHADSLNEKWLADHQQGIQAPAPSSVPSVEERVPSVPSVSTAPVTSSARALVSGTVKIVKASSTTQAFSTIPGGATLPAFKDVSQAFAGFAPSAQSKVELIQGRTADGQTRPLYVAMGDGKGKQGYWWFAPSDQPEGWFDEQGRRLGGTALAEPKPDSRISSPFGRRTYYGRSTSTAFHNGIDFEGKTGEPIYAAADGVINHMNWYFNYGRTVKISHADNFETLYAHMSRFAAGIGPGSHVKKGDLIGYVGSTGRSTGPHLHFSAIVNGQFVDPQQYLSEHGNGQLNGEALVSFRQWQQDVRAAATPAKRSSSTGNDNWSQNPFVPPSPENRL
jgi:murein DD-endopeptidase MepM/ murein hydrolase activator NlpD